MELRIPEPLITEAQINNLVDRFYAKVRLDPDLLHHSESGWAHHLATLEHFRPNSGEETHRYKVDLPRPDTSSSRSRVR
jgi:truncated hemoglobin YjbI